MDVLTQKDCVLISLVINYETYLQNQKKYCLNEIVTQEELDIYFDIVLGKKQELTAIFKLKNIIQKTVLKIGNFTTKKWINQNIKKPPYK